MRKTAMAIAFSVAVIMLAPIVSAGGGNGNGGPNGNGNWGNKDLPLTVDFVGIDEGLCEDAWGWMNWSATSDVFKFDMHAYNVLLNVLVDEGPPEVYEAVYYTLTYTTGDAPAPGDPVLGWGSASECLADGIVVSRVHIKGEVAWPDVAGATLYVIGYPAPEYGHSPALVSVEPIDLVQQ